MLADSNSHEFDFTTIFSRDSGQDHELGLVGAGASKEAVQVALKPIRCRYQPGHLDARGD